MSNRTYKILMTACITVILIGCAGVGVGLKGYIENRAKEHAAKLIQDVKDATVHLLVCQAPRPDGKKYCSTGTGFVVKIDDNGAYLLTNKHVCLGARLSQAEVRREDGVFQFAPIIATTQKGLKSGVAVVRVAQNADLCLLRTELKFKQALPLANYPPKRKDDMLTFGYPNSKPELNNGKFDGIKGMSLGFYGMTSAKVWYGASGSPAVNMNGEVIGVISNIYSQDVKSKDRKNVLYSLFVPLEIVREFLGGLK